MPAFDMSIKEVLRNLLEKSFSTPWSKLENRSEEQFSSWTVTSQCFTDFDSNLLLWVKQMEETASRQSDIQEKVEIKKPPKLRQSKTMGKWRESQRLQTSPDSANGNNKTKTNVAVIKNKTNITNKDKELNKVHSINVVKKATDDKRVFKRSKTQKLWTSKPKKGADLEKEPATGTATKNNKKTNTSSKSSKTLKSLNKDKPKNPPKTKELDKEPEHDGNTDLKVEEKETPGIMWQQPQEEAINNTEILEEKQQPPKEEVQEEELKTEVQIKPETSDEPRTSDYFIRHYNSEKWYDNIISYLDITDRISFTSSTKYLKHQHISIITTLKTSLLNRLNISPPKTITDKINEIQSKHSSEELTKPYPPFQMTKGALKAVELLNNDMYKQIYKKIALEGNWKEIILVYRILFQWLNIKEWTDVGDPNEFWVNSCDYLWKHSNGKIGTWITMSAKNFNFEDNNVYKVQKLVFGNNISPSYYSKICGSTGWLMFLIKDALEYCGIIVSDKKTMPSRIINNLNYNKGILERLDRFVDFMNGWK